MTYVGIDIAMLALLRDVLNAEPLELTEEEQDRLEAVPARDEFEVHVEAEPADFDLERALALPEAV